MTAKSVATLGPGRRCLWATLRDLEWSEKLTSAAIPLAPYTDPEEGGP
jgi:hypothetical protein